MGFQQSFSMLGSKDASHWLVVTHSSGDFEPLLVGHSFQRAFESAQ
jgi:hypothetical protein